MLVRQQIRRRCCCKGRKQQQAAGKANHVNKGVDAALTASGVPTTRRKPLHNNNLRLVRTDWLKKRMWDEVGSTLSMRSLVADDGP